MTHDIEKHKNDRQCVLQVNNYGYLIKHNTYNRLSIKTIGHP